jgi:hypothetical protein
MDTILKLIMEWNLFLVCLALEKRGCLLIMLMGKKVLSCSQLMIGSIRTTIEKKHHCIIFKIALLRLSKVSMEP